MKTLKIKLLSILAITFLYGCAGQPLYKPMQTSVNQKINSSTIIHGSTQKELSAEFEVSQAGGVSGAAFGALGGFIGALVDSSINQSRADEAEELVKPLRDYMIDYDFTNAMTDSLQAYFTDSKWNSDNLKVIGSGLNESFDDAIVNSSTDSALVVSTAYTMSSDFNDLKVTAHINLFPKTEDLKAIQKSLYSDSKIYDPKQPVSDVRNSIFRDQIFIHIPISNTKVEKLDAIKLWSANNGEPLVAAIQKAVSSMPELVNNSLSSTIGDTEDPKKHKINTSEKAIEINQDKYLITRNALGLTAIAK